MSYKNTDAGYVPKPNEKTGYVPNPNPQTRPSPTGGSTTISDTTPVPGNSHPQQSGSSSK